MNIQAKLLCAIAVSGFAAFAATAPAQALTTQECSAKYQAAKTAGTLNGQKWNDFRKANCGADATAAPAATPAAASAPAATAVVFSNGFSSRSAVSRLRSLLRRPTKRRTSNARKTSPPINKGNQFNWAQTL